MLMIKGATVYRPMGCPLYVFVGSQCLTVLPIFLFCLITSRDGNRIERVLNEPIKKNPTAEKRKEPKSKLVSWRL